MKNQLIIIAGVLMVGFAIMSFIGNFQDPWEVPDNYVKMENPISSDKESLRIGSSLYSKHCKSCHGREGLGDGPKAGQLNTPSGDFTTPEFHDQSDGALFYKTREGRGDMPSFEKKIPNEDDLWSIVNYIRTLQE